MKPPQRASPKKLDYPDETPGSRLAAKARKLASKLTPEQRREHFNGALAPITVVVKHAHEITNAAPKENVSSPENRPFMSNPK
jgi:hypothetical protein